VLFIDDGVYYSDGEPARAIMDEFAKRSDNQITTLEILAVAVGLSTFTGLLTGRRVVVWTDNKGAEVRVCICAGLTLSMRHVGQGSVKKGASSAWDQTRLIHEIWTLVCVQRVRVFVLSRGMPRATGTPEEDAPLDQPCPERGQHCGPPKPHVLQFASGVERGLG